MRIQKWKKEEVVHITIHRQRQHAREHNDVVLYLVLTYVSFAKTAHINSQSHNNQHKNVYLYSSSCFDRVGFVEQYYEVLLCKTQSQNT